MKKEKFDELVLFGICALREMDIQRGLIGENYEPFNGHLSAEENEKCWKCLARPFVRNILFSYFMAGKTITNDILLRYWLKFLQDVNDVVKCGDRDGTIEDIINNSGIPETTWVRFLD